MGFDHLKALSQHATASAVPAERLDTEDVATAPAAPSSVATESPTRPSPPRNRCPHLPHPGQLISTTGSRNWAP